VKAMSTVVIFKAEFWEWKLCIAHCSKHYQCCSQINSNVYLMIFGTSTISNIIVNDKIKCLYLLHCLREANPQHEMLSSVEAIFRREIIDLSDQPLSLNNMHTLAVLLLRTYWTP